MDVRYVTSSRGVAAPKAKGPGINEVPGGHPEDLNQSNLAAIEKLNALRRAVGSNQAGFLYCRRLGAGGTEA